MDLRVLSLHNCVNQFSIQTQNEKSSSHLYLHKHIGSVSLKSLMAIDNYFLIKTKSRTFGSMSLLLTCFVLSLSSVGYDPESSGKGKLNRDSASLKLPIGKSVGCILDMTEMGRPIPL